ncbi:uncharacterized protein LOC109829814 [Asparagus officinalis]|nr:uncharacterized protein LOC109829814 [Asparagus officinalis]
MGLPPNRALIQQQLRAARFYELRRLQLMKEQWAAKNRCRFSRNDGCGDEMGLIGPPLQKLAQQEPSVRAVFVGRRESKGTGVFIPRRAGAQTEPKRNPACSTVLLPVGVGNALNMKGVNEMWNEGKRSPLGPQRAAFSAHDARLPQEWTY